MSKIVKKRDLDLVIESAMKDAGVTPKETVKKQTIKKEIVKEEVKSEKNELLAESLKDFNRFIDYKI